MPNYTQLGDNSPDGAQFGVSTSSKIGFFGATPIAQPSASSFATSAVATASSADATTGLKAGVIACMNTLSGLGIWPAQS